MFARRSELAPLKRSVHRAVLILLMGVAGCSIFHRRPTAPPAPPALNVEVSQFVGSPLSGPTTQPARSFAENVAVRIDIDWIALQDFPADQLLPLDAESSLTSAPLSSGAVLTVGQNTRQIRFAGGNAAHAFVTEINSGKFGLSIQINHQSGMIAPGTTARFSGALSGGKDKTTRSIAFSIGRTATETTNAPATRPIDGMITISVQGLSSPPLAQGNHQDAHPIETSSGPEMAFMDNVPITDGGQFVILVPCKIIGTPWSAIVAHITTHQIADDASGAAAVAALRKDLADASARARAGVSAPPLGNVQELRSAISSLNHNNPLRPPLLFLAMNTGAKIAADFVLVADDSLLDQLRDQVISALKAQKDSTSLNNLSWILDRSALLLMTGQATKNTLSPELTTVLLLHAGEVGREPDSLEEIVKGINNSADLQLRLIGENFISLEDNSPAARVRAYDWLKAQGKAPEGFDPLADRKSRRDAINKALASNGGAP